MKPSIVLYKSLPADLRERLEQHFTVHAFNGLQPENREELRRALQQAEGIIGSGGKIDEAFLQQAPKLRAASTVSVGYDNFDVEALNAHNVLLMHTPTVLTETVADTIMSLVLATARRVVEVAERVKAGEWRGSIGPDWFGVDVHHKTIGILGMGRIGRRWRSARTSASACRCCTTPAARTKRRSNASTPVAAIWIPCWPSRISFASRCR